MTVLVTLGNINLGTFENVCLACAATYPDEIEKLLVFDTKEAVAEGRESARNESVRAAFPGVEIRSRAVSDTEIQTTLPLTLAWLLREVGPAKIIIDLTNGQKAATGVLYAVASISKIERIHSLEIKSRDKLGKSLRDLTPGSDWDYVKLEPVKEIDTVAQESYLELLRYQEEITAAIQAVQTSNSDFAQRVSSSLTQALEDYFAGRDNPGRYGRSVATSGIVGEEIAKAVYHYCKRAGKAQAAVVDFAGYVQQLRVILDGLRSRKTDWEAQGEFGRQMAPVLPIDALLATTAILRNFAAHPERYPCRKEEARLMLDMSLLMLKRLGTTHVLAAE